QGGPRAAAAAGIGLVKAREDGMDSAWICAAKRTPFTRAGKGALAAARPDDLLASLFRRLPAALPAGAGEAVDGGSVGCALAQASVTPAERVGRRAGVRRADQDSWALRSHQRAAAARARGVFAAEIEPVTVPASATAPAIAAVPAGALAPEASAADGAPRDVRDDDALRPDSTLAKLAALAPAFGAEGTVTAGNACPTSDGASALLVASGATVAEFGLKPLGRFVSYAVAGVDPALMGLGPVEAVPRALARAGLSLDQMDRIELNEAFASQVLAVVRELGLPDARTNVNGGAIAIGHPLGATGVRLVGTLLRELARSGGRYGLATLCVGGGMGAAMVLERADG